jgi:hypothetical protein
VVQYDSCKFKLIGTIYIHDKGKLKVALAKVAIVKPFVPRGSS